MFMLSTLKRNNYTFEMKEMIENYLSAKKEMCELRNILRKSRNEYPVQYGN